MGHPPQHLLPRRPLALPRPHQFTLVFNHQPRHQWNHHSNHPTLHRFFRRIFHRMDLLRFLQMSRLWHSRNIQHLHHQTDLQQFHQNHPHPSHLAAQALNQVLRRLSCRPNFHPEHQVWSRQCNLRANRHQFIPMGLAKVWLQAVVHRALHQDRYILRLHLLEIPLQRLPSRLQRHQHQVLLPNRA